MSIVSNNIFYIEEFTNYFVPITQGSLETGSLNHPHPICTISHSCAKSIAAAVGMIASVPSRMHIRDTHI